MDRFKKSSEYSECHPAVAARPLRFIILLYRHSNCDNLSPCPIVKTISPLIPRGTAREVATVRDSPYFI